MTNQLLLSSSGRGNLAIFIWWFMWLGAGIVGAAILFVSAAKTRNPDLVAWYNIGGVVSIVMCLIFAILYHLAIAQTEIQIYEDCVAGQGVGKGFIWGDPRVFGFRLGYDQITSVDVAENTIIVHASGAQYKCYVNNPKKIQKVIFDLRSRTG